MSNVKLHPCGHCLRLTLIIWNIFVLLVGATAVGVGIWQVVEGNNYAELTGSSVVTGAAISIVSGVIAIAVALIGIFGAIALSRVALGIYAAIIVIFVILELISGILGFVYRDRVESTATDNAVQAIEDFYNKTSARNLVNEIQNDFECCGWNNYTDWGVQDIPSSCNCTDTDGNDNDDDSCTMDDAGNSVYSKGCRDGVVDFLRGYQLIVGALGIVFAVVQALVVVISLALCGCVHRARAEYTTV